MFENYADARAEAQREYTRLATLGSINGWAKKLNLKKPEPSMNHKVCADLLSLYSAADTLRTSGPRSFDTEKTASTAKRYLAYLGQNAQNSRTVSFELSDLTSGKPESLPKVIDLIFDYHRRYGQSYEPINKVDSTKHQPTGKGDLFSVVA